VNDDGRIDLTTADYSSNSISVLQNEGDFQFASPLLLPAGDLPHSISGADLNGDAQVDLVAANSGSGTLSVYMNQGGGVFAPHVDVPSGATPFAASCGDWNSDGVVDIASLNRGEDTVSLMWNQDATGPAVQVAQIVSTVLGAAPNPFRSKTEVQFQLPRAAEIRLHVFDLQGREIAQLFEGQRGMGRHSVLWNGEDSHGRPVAAGIYFLQLEAGGKTMTHKVLRVR
jgi:hypothetical protein